MNIPDARGQSDTQHEGGAAPGAPRDDDAAAIAAHPGGGEPTADRPGGGDAALQRRTKVRAWFRLLRVPNLFTVPGDPAAGFLLAWTVAPGRPSAAAILPAILACLLLYSAGLLLNDFFDLGEDRRDRPTRPLPAGDVRPLTALITALVLLALGIAAAILAGAAAGAAAGALAAAIVIYDAGGKRSWILGPMNMGVCRGLSLLVGAAAAGGWLGLKAWPALASAVGLALYVTVVTAIAKGETRAARIGARRFLPPAVLLAWLGLMFAALCRPWVQSLLGNQLGQAGAEMFLLHALPCMILSAAAIAVSMCLGVRYAMDLKGAPDPATVQAAVGGLIRNLLPAQAALAAMSLARGSLLAAGVLLVAWPLSLRLGRSFDAS